MEENNVQVVVQQLTAEVERKETNLKTLTSELEEIKTLICQLQQNRQDCIENLFQSQEVSPLVCENRLTRRELKEKKEKLDQLSREETSEQIEVDELARHLEDLHSCRLIKQLDDTHAENTQALEKLNEEYEEKMQSLQSARDALKKLNSEVTRLKAENETALICSQSRNIHGKTKTSKKQTIDEKLDKLVFKTCQRAGLELEHT